MVSPCAKPRNVPLDCHLMIENADDSFRHFADAGADWISVHQEACLSPESHAGVDPEPGCLAGVVINPATPVETLGEVLDIVDRVLVMSVNPGFGARNLFPAFVHKVRRLAELRGRGG